LVWSLDLIRVQYRNIVIIVLFYSKSINPIPTNIWSHPELASFWNWVDWCRPTLACGVADIDLQWRQKLEVSINNMFCVNISHLYLHAEGVRHPKKNQIVRQISSLQSSIYSMHSYFEDEIFVKPYEWFAIWLLFKYTFLYYYLFYIESNILREKNNKIQNVCFSQKQQNTSYIL